MLLDLASEVVLRRFVTLADVQVETHPNPNPNPNPNPDPNPNPNLADVQVEIDRCCEGPSIAEPCSVRVV